MMTQRQTIDLIIINVPSKNRTCFELNKRLFSPPSPSHPRVPSFLTTCTTLPHWPHFPENLCAPPHILSYKTSSGGSSSVHMLFTVTDSHTLPITRDLYLGVCVACSSCVVLPTGPLALLGNDQRLQLVCHSSDCLVTQRKQ